MPGTDVDERYDSRLNSKVSIGDAPRKRTLLSCGFVTDLPHQDLDLRACDMAHGLHGPRPACTHAGWLEACPIWRSLLWVIISMDHDAIVGLVDEMRAPTNIIQVRRISCMGIPTVTTNEVHKLCLRI